MLRILKVEYEKAVDEKLISSSIPVSLVQVVIGDMHQIVDESFIMAYETLTAGTPFEGSRLVIEKQRVHARCPECGWEGAVNVPFFLCGGCGGGGLEIISGKEMYIREMEITDCEG
jgi:hydrogenase nickel incorporation protein HypA/HybF